MHTHFGRIIVAGVFATLITASPAHAANLVLQGSFTGDDEVQLFNILLSGPASVDRRSYGYGGGTLSSGAVVLGGGFDTVLTPFDASGNALAENDDGVGVAIDPSTGEAWDARITQLLAPGSYILSVSQYDSFVTGNNIRDGFNRLGESAFTELVAIQSFD